MRLAAAVVAGMMAVGGCGEPPIDVDIPQRAEDVHLADLAGVLDAEALSQPLETAESDGLDIVVLTYETPQASCGEAFRAGAQFVAAWDGDVAVVAVAQPGDFTSTDDSRQRCLGLQPRDERAVPGDVREHIVEELVPPFAAANDWTGAVAIAITELAAQ